MAYTILAAIFALGISSVVSQIDKMSLYGKEGFYGYDAKTDIAFISFDKQDQGRWQSKEMYQYGKFSVQIKFPAGYSAGVVVTSYLISSSEPGSGRDEIDFELLGHTDPSRVVIHTNYYSNGKGSHEEQFNVWYDPTQFHTYTVIWGPTHIVWMVDGIPIRELNTSSPDTSVSKAMHWQGSVWDGSSWATRDKSGILKVDYTYGPFKAEYKSFSLVSSCSKQSGSDTCQATGGSFSWDGQLTEDMMGAMRMYRRDFLKYSYNHEELPNSKKSQKEATSIPRTKYYRVRRELLKKIDN